MNWPGRQLQSSILMGVGVLFVWSCMFGVVDAAPAARKTKTKTKRKKKVKLPPIPMLRAMPKFRKLSILRKNALRGLKMPPRKKKVILPGKKRKRLPTRPPKPVRPIRMTLPGVKGGSTPLSRTQRKGVKVRREWSKGKAGVFRLIVRKLEMGRGGLMRRWSGVIVIRSNQLLFYCPLRSFCRTLRKQTRTLVRRGLRWKKNRVSQKSPQFPWVLRRGLERSYGYAVVIRSLQK